MAYISKRSTLMAAMVESVENTPLPPGAATDYFAVQDDYDFNPAFDLLENAELAGSIGKAKSILGQEKPTISFSHYIRHSGVEGQEPTYGKLLHGLFGAKSVAATEYNTVASSTISQVKVDTGEGATFEAGEALMVKKTTGVGYEIRNIGDVSGDNLNLAFNLADAPGTGVNLGKAVLYKPADTHPSLTLWGYEGNAGAVQMESGCKVGSMSMTVDPAGLINGQFNIEGTEYFFNPYRIVSTDAKLNFNIGGSELTATIAVGYYKSPQDLAAAIQTAMQAAGGTGVTCTYSNSTGKFTIAKPSGTLELLWNTGADTANTIGDLIGFTISADDTGFLTYTSDNAPTLAAPHTPSFDTSNPLVGKDGEVYIGDATDISCFGARNFTLTVTNTLAMIPDICEASGSAGRRAVQRTIEMTLLATASQYDSGKFEKYRNNTTAKFMFNVGAKSGGNWVPGTCLNVFMPTATISAFKVGGADDLSVFEMSVTAFVLNGAAECYLNLL
jgi:hypothetical protein